MCTYCDNKRFQKKKIIQKASVLCLMRICFTNYKRQKRKVFLRKYLGITRKNLKSLTRNDDSSTSNYKQIYQGVNYTNEWVDQASRNFHIKVWVNG